MREHFTPSGVPAGLYGLFARAFDHPDATFWDGVEGRPLIAALGVDPAEWVPAEVAAATVGRRPQDQREAEYVAAFEGGVPAYEGLCRAEEGRDGILEDLLRFYHYFDLKLNERHRDFPDSFVTEFEFMNYLTELEEIAVARGGDAASLQRAQRDFLGRHLALWTERLVRRLRERGVDNAYARLAGWLNAMARAHRDRLEESLKDDAASAAAHGRSGRDPSVFQSYGGQP